MGQEVERAPSARATGKSSHSPREFLTQYLPHVEWKEDFRVVKRGQGFFVVAILLRVSLVWIGTHLTPVTSNADDLG